jgi:hypothetical protein
MKGCQYFIRVIIVGCGQRHETIPDPRPPQKHTLGVSSQALDPQRGHEPHQ